MPFESELLENNVLVATHTDVLLVHVTSPDSDSDSEQNILDPDDDNDGMPDTWELRFGFNPLSAADATQNPDGDGLVNRDEFRLGYHPRVADYVFADGFGGGTTRWHQRRLRRAKPEAFRGSWRRARSLREKRPEPFPEPVAGPAFEPGTLRYAIAR